MSQENVVSIPPGIDCSIRGQRSPYDKLGRRFSRYGLRRWGPKPNEQGGITFGRGWTEKDWLKDKRNDRS